MFERSRQGRGPRQRAWLGFVVAALTVWTGAALQLAAAPRARTECVAAAQDEHADLPIVRVVADDTLVDCSCRLVFGDEPIVDVNDDGVVHVLAQDIEIVCEGRLQGATPGLSPDEYQGQGIVVRGARVTLRGAHVSGFRVGIAVESCFESQIIDADVSDNRRQRLRSTWEREDESDWLQPHDNDAGEWSRNYGAGLRVVDSRGVRVERLLARDVQNGILFERVEGSLVIGCDASFLSGWGLALWRSSNNRVLANRFDFCVRGYVHGRYNRGQDSAGVLLFEQSSHNTFQGNSLTHGGDGVFGFAGREALGEVAPPAVREGEPPFDSTRRGCNGNIFRANDLSCAAAHGLELTFSFDAYVEGNLFEDNSICAVWFGYARDSVLQENRFIGNGLAGYGAERGAVNAEHAQRLSLSANVFEDNALDVRLWSDDDSQIAALPWGLSNGMATKDNWVAGNDHRGVAAGVDAPWIELLDVGATACDLDARRVDADEASRAAIRPMPPGELAFTQRAAQIEPGQLARYRAELLATNGVEALPPHPAVRGRSAIVMGEWGPYDHASVFLQPLEERGDVQRYRVLGPPGTQLDHATLAGPADGVERSVLVGDDIDAALREGAVAIVEVRPKVAGVPTPYALEIAAGGATWNVTGDLLSTTWSVRCGPSSVDPREDAAAWRAALEQVPAFQLDDLALDFDGAGPVELLRERDLSGAAASASERGVGADHFGLLASTTLALPAGRWRLATRSDDGLRVTVDGALVIDDWTWHGPRDIDATFEVDGSRPVEIEAAYFELDGHAVLRVALERAP